MKINCSFHPSTPAHFHCQSCDATFCASCIEIRENLRFRGDSKDYFCPTCNLPATPVGIGNLIEPFWARLPKFFSYPAQLHPLLVILILSFAATVFTASIFLQLLFFVISTKYAYAILIETAKGSLQPPKLTFELFNKDVEQVFKQYVVFFLIGGAATFLVQYVGLVGLVIFMIFTTIYMPAILMVLVASNSVLAALNPMIFVPVVNRIGARYFLMYVFLILLPVAPAALLNYLPAMLPLAVHVFMQSFFQHYYTFLTYSLMGYVLLQYHEEIGYAVDYEFFVEKSLPKEAVKQLSPAQKLLNHVGILVKSGKNEEAIEAILQKTQGKFSKEEADFSEKFLTLLRICQREKGVAKHAPVHLDMLVELNRKEKAIGLYEELFVGSSKIQPSEKAVLKLAEWFRDRKEYQKSVNCYVGFINKNPKHPLLPDAYFALMRLLHEHVGNTAKAIKLAEALVNNFPDHVLTPKVKTYMESMA